MYAIGAVSGIMTRMSLNRCDCWPRRGPASRQGSPFRWSASTKERPQHNGEHMRTTIDIDDSLLKKAAKLTGFSEKTLLVRRGLGALIALESGRRLAQLGGTEKKLSKIPRRRPDR